MSELINLREIEKKAWKSFFQDGIWDITFGLILLAFSVGAFMDTLGISNGVRMATYIGVELIAFAWMIIARKYITVPRLGQVKFSNRRRKKRLWVSVLLGLSVLAGLIVYYLTARNSATLISPQTMPIIWAINCIIVFGGMAYFLDFDRMYLIGLLYALTVPFDQYVLTRLSDADLSYLAFFIPGLIVLAMGLIIFIRFLKQYPAPQKEANDGG
jgi:hypothetical protein